MYSQLLGKGESNNKQNDSNKINSNAPSPSDKQHDIAPTAAQTVSPSISIQCEKYEKPTPPKLSDLLKHETKWQSPEALYLFTGKVRKSKMRKKNRKKKRKHRNDKDEEMIDVRKHAIEKCHDLRKAYLTSDGWK